VYGLPQKDKEVSQMEMEIPFSVKVGLGGGKVETERGKMPGLWCPPLVEKQVKTK
jgi:hypothetical protein